MNTNLMIIKKEENREVKIEQKNIYKNIIKGYRECMPEVSEELLDFRFFMNNHFLNTDFEKEPKYFVAFDDSSIKQNGIVAISALYVFPKYRGNGYAKILIEQLKYLAQNNIYLQIAVNEKKYPELKNFYKNLDFKTTGIASKPDDINIKYIDLFWCILPMKLTHTPNGTMIDTRGYNI